MKKITLLILIIVLGISLISDTHIAPGFVSGVWTAEGSPYYIDGTIYTPAFETLTIMPGVEVIFTGHYKYRIQGNLQAVGTVNDSICFTIADTSGFSDYCGFEGGWHGLRFLDTSDHVADTLRLVHCHFEYGKAISLYLPDGDGGAVYCDNSENLLIRNCTFSNNISNQNGGAIYLCNQSDILIENTIFCYNLSQSGGSAICTNYSSPKVKRTLIHHNRNAGWFGTICLYNHSSPHFENVTIVDNSSEPETNYTVYMSDSCFPYFTNCILWNNLDEEIHCNGGGGTNLIIICYSNVRYGEDAINTNYNGGLFWLDGNMFASPNFVDQANHNYELQPFSICVDHGTSYYEWNEDILIDLDEDEFYGDAPDIGYYEYTPTDNIENEIEPAVSQIEVFPNPFNPVTTVSFSADDGEMLELVVYNAKGQRVKTLYKGIFAPDLDDSQTVIWDGMDDRGRKVSSGIYLIKLEITGKGSYSEKCLMLK